MTGLIMAYIFGVLLAIYIVVILVMALVSLLGIVLGFLMKVLMFGLLLIVGVIGAVVVWELSKKAWENIQELRRYLKKNKEIKERMEAMRK